MVSSDLFGESLRNEDDRSDGCKIVYFLIGQLELGLNHCPIKLRYQKEDGDYTCFISVIQPMGKL